MLVRYPEPCQLGQRWEFWTGSKRVDLHAALIPGALRAGRASTYPARRAKVECTSINLLIKYHRRMPCAAPKPRLASRPRCTAHKLSNPYALTWFQGGRSRQERPTPAYTTVLHVPARPADRTTTDQAPCMRPLEEVNSWRSTRTARVYRTTRAPQDVHRADPSRRIGRRRAQSRYEVRPLLAQIAEDSIGDILELPQPTSFPIWRARARVGRLRLHD